MVLDHKQVLDELAWRGLIHQYTEGLAESLSAGPVSAYCGFDPSAPSLHVGHLVPVMGLVHLQRAGHRPIALVGGGTGMIGDPSGKRAERVLLTPEIVNANSATLRGQLEHFLDFRGPSAARMRNNADWLLKLDAIGFMRDVGKHFTVNYMLQKESVKARLDEGISYTEFSYMLLQAYDFLQLHEGEGATLQIGGSDQWGNITAGIELIRRAAGKEAHALTFPLVTAASGKKFGKTEAGAVWLDASRTSPYRFYQFWVNVDDRDIGRYLRYFSLRPRSEIETLDRETADHPEQRSAQQALAREMTARVHGEESARVAGEVSALLFGTSEPKSLSAKALQALAEEVPFVRLASDGAGLDVLELFTRAKLVTSKGAARRLLEQGGLYVNGDRLSASDKTLGKEHLLTGGHLLLRKGAREYALVKVE
jgi:tyrosyl-tRNA synthetase